MKLAWGALAMLFGCASAGCTVGDGSGTVQTTRLYLKECWNGPFDLQPDFFGANPYRQESLLIRIQRGDNNQESSDGLSVIVNDLAAVELDTPIPVGLPPGVAPPGQPLTGAEAPLVSISLSVGIGLIFWLLTTLFEAAGKQENLPAGIAVWGPHILFGAVGLYLNFVRYRLQ